jgi:hypothetical protein
MMHPQHPYLDCRLNQGQRLARQLLGDGPRFEEVVKVLSGLVDQ